MKRRSRLHWDAMFRPCVTDILTHNVMRFKQFNTLTFRRFKRFACENRLTKSLSNNIQVCYVIMQAVKAAIFLQENRRGAHLPFRGHCLLHYVTETSHLHSLRDFWRHFGLCRAAAHSDCCFFSPCTNILTYLLTYTGPVVDITHNLWCMASATPDLRLPSQSKSSATAHWPVLISHPADGWVGLSGWLHTKKVGRLYPQTVARPSTTNRVGWEVTSLIWPTLLLLGQQP